jgi:uncharacterized membrane protein YgdD (TMEM256/DUF423 family)
MTRAWLAAAAVGGFFSVAAGGAAAHLAAQDGHAAELLQTGALYGIVHAAALVGLSAIAERRQFSSVALDIAGWCFASGLLLFSLSLFALAATGLTADRRRDADRRSGVARRLGGARHRHSAAPLGTEASLGAEGRLSELGTLQPLAGPDALCDTRRRVADEVLDGDLALHAPGLSRT